MNVTKLITKVNKTVLTNKKNEYIVIHYTGNKTDKAINNAKYFETVNRGASAHYFVDKTSIYQCVEDKDGAWAVGKNYGTKNLYGKCNNDNSISIEMCSDNGAIADATFNNTVDLVKSLMKKYGIAADKVVRHYDVCSKACPGWKGWIPTTGDESIWKKFKAAIQPSAPIIQIIDAPTGYPQVPFTVKVIINDLNIRKGPSTTYATAGYAQKATYIIIEVKNDFGKLKSGAGWIYLKNDKYVTVLSSTGAATQPSAQQASTTKYVVRVTAAGLNIRKGPGTSYAIAGTIKDKGRYTIVETKNGWGKLASGIGYISLAYTKKV